LTNEVFTSSSLKELAAESLKISGSFMDLIIGIKSLPLFTICCFHFRLAN